MAHRGKARVERDDKSIVRAMLVELESKNFNQNLKNHYLHMADLQLDSLIEEE